MLVFLLYVATFGGRAVPHSVQNRLALSAGRNGRGWDQHGTVYGTPSGVPKIRPHLFSTAARLVRSRPWSCSPGGLRPGPGTQKKERVSSRFHPKVPTNEQQRALNV